MTKDKEFRKMLTKQRRAMGSGKWVMDATIIQHDNGDLEVVWVERRRDEWKPSRPNEQARKMLQTRLS
tara:strand:+ start:218 stop:421 length:204 start_codon:yes stop_codon:yes gene_type:complete